MRTERKQWDSEPVVNSDRATIEERQDMQRRWGKVEQKKRGGIKERGNKDK